MASGGAMAYGPREGFRSETLARFALSAFGPTTHVEPADDYGIDLVCATGRREGKRLHVGPSYLVQVKSESDKEVPYEGDQAARWLDDLGNPLLVCVTDKKAATVRLYSTWNLSRVLLQVASTSEQPKVFRLLPDEEFSVDQPPPDRIPLGKPIVAFDIQQLAEEGMIDRLTTCIEEWVAMDAENIVRRRMGLHVAKGYTSWETNKPPSAFVEWYKPYFFSPKSAEHARDLLAECAAMIALMKDQKEIELLRAYLKSPYGQEAAKKLGVVRTWHDF